MRSLTDDRTAKATIRDEALSLFAAHGADAVTVRQIAAAAGVSPALVLRHYNSKDGLREAVDAHVLRLFDAMLGELTREVGPPHAPESAGPLAEAMLRHLPAGSPVPRYLGRMLLERSEAGHTLFRRLLTIGESTLEAMTNAGLAAPGADPRARAAFLTVNDLAVLLLRDQLADWLGVDPLSKAGMTRWAGEALAVYAHGLGPVADRPDSP